MNKEHQPLTETWTDSSGNTVTRMLELPGNDPALEFVLLREWEDERERLVRAGYRVVQEVSLDLPTDEEETQ